MRNFEQHRAKNQTIQFVDDLINIHGRKSYTSLLDFEKEKLAGLRIKSLSSNPLTRGDEVLCISESNHAEETIDALANFLITDNLNNHENFIETVKKNTVRFYENQMEELFEERVNYWESEKNNEASFIQRQDSENGEYYWTL